MKIGTATLEVVPIAREGIETSNLGRCHWIVGACLDRPMNNRRMVRRYEREAEHLQAFADLAYVLLCCRRQAEVTN